MSLQWHLPTDIPDDTARVGVAILKLDNVYRQLGDRFTELAPDAAAFASLYEPTGRGAIAPVLLALVTVFQMLEKAPDRLAAEWVVSRLDWKYALHLPLTYAGFHFTDLYAFRQRLLAHQQAALVFDQLLDRLRALGVLPVRSRVRTDSTHLLGAVERLSRLELLTESVRLAVGAVSQLAPDWVAQTLPATFRETYGRRRSEYGLSQSQVREKLDQVGQDGGWFLAQLEASGPLWTRHLPEVETLRTVLSQQASPPDASPPPTPPTAETRIVSPHEPEVRYGEKRGQGWLGYKVQVTETCEAHQPHLIVDLVPTSAPASDSPQVAPIQARLAARGLIPTAQYVDQGYMSAAHVVDSAAQGITLKGQLPPDTHAATGFQQADFVIDPATPQATCPQGQTSVVWRTPARTREAMPRTQVRFDGPTCQACPAFGVCTTNVKGRSLELHPLRAVIAAQRALAATEAYQRDLHVRAGIEGTISELVRGHGLRRARYRGQAKLGLQCYFTAVAVNLKRLTRWWTAQRAASTPLGPAPASALAA